jgi:hypothetical protein
MSNPTYSTFSSEVRGSDALTQLALDLNWSWNHSADEIWKYLDPELWQLPANPWLTCGAGLLSWQDDIAGRWKDVRVGPLLVRTEAGRKHNRYRSVSRRPGSECRAVELYADSQDGGDPFRLEMHLREPHSDNSASYKYWTNAPIRIRRPILPLAFSLAIPWPCRMKSAACFGRSEPAQ